LVFSALFSFWSNRTSIITLAKCGI
jgi:hypothetical protein